MLRLHPISSLIAYVLPWGEVSECGFFGTGSGARQPARYPVPHVALEA